jgi:hypothetical protein
MSDVWGWINIRDPRAGQEFPGPNSSDPQEILFVYQWRSFDTVPRYFVVYLAGNSPVQEHEHLEINTETPIFFPLIDKPP